MELLRKHLVLINEGTIDYLFEINWSLPPLTNTKYFIFATVFHLPWYAHVF